MKNSGKVVEDLNNEELAKSIIIRVSAAFSDLRPYKKKSQNIVCYFSFTMFHKRFCA
jgi:hypothetical protein